MSEYIVELKNATKRFPGVVALRNMSIKIRPGEIHGLIGENGAGKSTLIKILTGVYGADEGEIWVDGNKCSFNDPKQARDAGIACVYQEMNIVKELSITDNIFMGRNIRKKFGLLDYSTMHKKAREAMTSLGQDIDPKKLCGSLGMGIQQMVEIARSVLFDAKLIIMDEPTSSLGEKETEQLMETVRKLKKNGMAILFVSHKLEELFELCDCVTVMRDGEHILTDRIDNINNDKLINAMVGRSLKNLYPKVKGRRETEALRVEGLTSAGVFNNISFSAYRGEVLGFAGLVGAGRTEIFRAIFGADQFEKGKIFVNGEQVKIKSPDDAIRHRIAFLTEDRKGQGLVLSQPIRTNLIMANMRGFSHGLWLDNQKIENKGQQCIQTLRIKASGLNEVAGQLSGGNQQKVVVGKWLNTDADIFIFDEPTRGIDVGAKIEVYNIINNLVQDGKCVIMISSELPEILGMSDRVIVMRSGKIMADIEECSRHFNKADIMKAAWGGKLE
jgi:ribose transport system ATP-binding protein